jgi:hypothetical protein
MRLNIQALIDYHILARIPFWRDEFWHLIARRLPAPLLYWAVIIGGVKAAGPNRSAEDTTLLDMLDTLKP